MQECVEDFIRVSESSGKDKETISDELRKMARKVADFHLEHCHGGLLRGALAVAAAICEYAREIEEPTND